VSADSLAIETTVEPGLWLNGAAHELRSAFSNLVQNAVRYTGPDGRVSIRWQVAGEGAMLQVEDTGIGIPPQHLPRLTERFYRVDVGRSRQGGGTGLGLAIVKHVLNRHEARLTIASEPGEGSVFTCLFPPERVLRRERRVPAQREDTPALASGE
jgi:two-component system phosphate regulon sensor histidine kinase PhoR